MTQCLLRVSYPDPGGYTFETIMDEKAARACAMQANLIYGPDTACFHPLLMTESTTPD